MKYSFRDIKKLQAKNQVELSKIKEILSSGVKTVRRVFYMLGSRSYDSVGKLITWARLNGEISWESIVEEGRNLQGSRAYDNTQDFMDDISNLYVKRKESAFRQYFEVWLEKATLERIFYPLTNKYDVGLLVTRGCCSWTALKKASDRIPKNSVIIYFGDNDDYGKKMYKRNKKFLNDLGCYPKFIKPALTNEQEKKFKFPRGEHHLDGMPEQELAKLLEVSIKKFIIQTKFNDLVKQEEEDKEKLKELKW